MNYNSNHEELVSKYLEGEMTDVEKHDFEQQLVKNDALKEEFQFQKDILHEVQNVRKAELKARLNNIKVPANHFYQYVGVKTAALVAITVLIGFGAYYFLSEDQVQSTSQVDLTKDRIVVAEEENIPQMPEPEQGISQDAPISKQDEARELAATPAEDNQVAEQEELAQAPRPTNVPQPNVSTPDVEDGFGEDEYESEEDPLDNIHSIDEMNKTESEKVEVETVPNDNKDFHYQFYNNKLYLYGNFDEMPYEIIEFNADKSKLYFLFYDSAYYSLDNNQLKAAPLQELTDEELIQQLDELRSK